jgi:hypothetical protein
LTGALTRIAKVKHPLHFPIPLLPADDVVGETARVLAEQRDRLSVRDHGPAIAAATSSDLNDAEHALNVPGL